MFFHTVKSPGLALLSYMVGSQGECAVIDPRRDIDIYLQLARAEQLEITHIIETHIHADFVSGSRELAARTGAKIYGGQVVNKTQGDYGFKIHTLKDGDTLKVGGLSLRALHTPGHSSEHMSFVLKGGGQGAEEEWALFSGDTLFAGEVGRPDLEPGAEHRELAGMLFDSLHDKILKLDDSVEVYPGHGEGSPCGSSIGARDHTTIGYERQYNPRLQIKDRQEFVDSLLEELDAEPMPAYYSRLKVLNHRGPEVLGALGNVARLSPDEFEALAKEPDTLVLDTREIAAFAAAHIDGSLNIGIGGAFVVWAGRILTPDQSLLMVGDDADSVAEARAHLLRIGLDIRGYLAGGIQAWFNAAKPFKSSGFMSVHQLKEKLSAGLGEAQLLDVRPRAEWESGHIEGATNLYVPDLNDGAGELDKSRPVITYCGSGFRASVAASILLAAGFERVTTVAGSMLAWRAAGYPLS